MKKLRFDRDLVVHRVVGYGTSHGSFRWFGRPEGGLVDGLRPWAAGEGLIEHAGPLGSLGLNGAGETADEFIPTDAVQRLNVTINQGKFLLPDWGTAPNSGVEEINVLL
ncbi:protein kinase domain superfamily protein [Dorcoceras hygrometricum]|uniref:Protein kinase domain superfamily protein n=1 Tax=Dorcoceras hygrometricum TaxID=472368 RepID=A0A2Z7ATK2_9LAMI|nr:protein kinase domain superfamily protein [Dorcoceras hygrometricum]